MKLFTLLLTFTLSAQAFAARDAASRATNMMANQALGILALKSDEDRFNQMCALLKSKVQSSHIATVWLGRYAGLSTDRSGETAFRAMIPSIIMTKLVQALGNKEVKGSLTVGQRSTDRGDGIWDVRVTARGSDKSYTGVAVMKLTGSKFRLQDGRYMGFSAVNYLKSEYQDILNEKAATTRKPISALVQQLKSQPEFLDCH